MQPIGESVSLSFKATNPVLVAAFTPAFVALVPLVVLFNQIEGFWKGFAIGFFIIYILIMAVITFALSIKKYEISITKSMIQIDKKQFQFADLQKITFKEKSRYIYLKNKQKWGSQTFCIQDQQEYEKVSTRLRELATAYQIEIENS